MQPQDQTELRLVSSSMRSQLAVFKGMLKLLWKQEKGILTLFIQNCKTALVCMEAGTMRLEKLNQSCVLLIVQSTDLGTHGDVNQLGTTGFSLSG